MQCYNQLNNSSVKKRKALGADSANYCDANMVAECKLDFMVYEIYSMLFSEKKNKVMIEQAIKLVSKCYATKPVDHDLKAVNRDIAKLKGKITNLVDMRADGDLSKEEYRRRRLVDDDAEIQSTMTLTFEQARAWRLRNGDYTRSVMDLVSIFLLKFYS